MGELKESQIQKEVLDFLHSLGVFCWRQNNVAIRGRKFVGMKGIPDIMGILGEPEHGKFFGVEIKKPGENLTEDQTRFKCECEARGGIYILARGVEDLTNFLELFNKNF